MNAKNREPNGAAAVNDALPPLDLAGDSLREAAREFTAALRARVRDRQDGLPSYFDNYWLGVLGDLDQLDPDAPWERSAARLPGLPGVLARAQLARVRALLARWRQGRFVSVDEREPGLAPDWRAACEIDPYPLAMSQGVAEPLQWRGEPLFKTAFDFSLYPMLLWNERPRTVVELGSGTGTSAIWLADLLAMYAIPCHVYSVDRRPPARQHPGVTFLAGDCERIEAVFADAFLREAPHPWLFVEDAHVNVCGVLRHFHRYFQPGDYAIVEDSASRAADVQRFLREHADAYRIDTRYTDFFGRNATCAMDAILRRV